MRTWDDWSDFEVNCRVEAELAGFGSSFLATGDRSSVYQDGFGGGLSGRRIRDYCNSWDDMGPLIQQELITLDYLDGFGWTATPAFNGGSIEVSCYANPLRAAAIVFLMMNGVKP